MDSLIIFLDEFFRWVDSLTLERIFAMYWYMFIFTIPRFYILEWLILLIRMIGRGKRIKREEQAMRDLYADFPFVSVIAPGKNEGDNIFKLATSLREQTYSNFEITIIDDGSDDNSYVICNDLLKRGYINRFISLDFRGGKASAANAGLYKNNAKYVVHLDADSSLDRNAIEQILMPFYLSDKIKAVGGSVKVRNDKVSLCTSLQALEYMETIMVSRTVNSYLGVLRIVSGAFGAFDMQTLKALGGWDIGPGLDGDITQKIRKIGGEIAFNHQSVCLTNVPERFNVLFKQRLRWSKSLTRFRIRKHNDIFNVRSANFSIRNFVANLDNVMYNFLLDYVWLYYLVTVAVNNFEHINMIVVLGIVVMTPFRLVGFLVCLLFSERTKTEAHLVKLIPLQYFYSGVFLRINRIIAGIMEFFFFSSYRDPWNPEKSSFHARANKL